MPPQKETETAYKPFLVLSCPGPAHPHQHLQKFLGQAECSVKTFSRYKCLSFMPSDSLEVTQPSAMIV